MKKRKRQYELRWTGNIKRNGSKELIWVKIKQEFKNGNRKANQDSEEGN